MTLIIGRGADEEHGGLRCSSPWLLGYDGGLVDSDEREGRCVWDLRVREEIGSKGEVWCEPWFREEAGKAWWPVRESEMGGRGGLSPPSKRGGRSDAM
ncbi:unnamed protein product, partial [Sphenostylis stenocarpa]